ncbi:hypothetical protein GCM10027577_33830 [Spirosoma fluminis]
MALPTKPVAPVTNTCIRMGVDEGAIYEGIRLLVAGGTVDINEGVPVYKLNGYNPVGAPGTAFDLVNEAA